MVLLSIEYNPEDKMLYEKITELCKFFKEKSISIAIAECNEDRLGRIKCILRDDEVQIEKFAPLKDIFYIYAADIICEMIVREYELPLVKTILEKSYDYLEDVELEDILDKTTDAITGMGIISSECYTLAISRRNNIRGMVEKYIREESSINIEGFVRFRMKNMKSDLTVLVDKIMEEYIVENEYSEFVKLLKYFVEIQESKYEAVNIYFKPDGRYDVLDVNSKNIEKDFFEDLPLKQEEQNRYDILISALITSSPDRVILHHAELLKDQEVVETIKSIFCERIEICSGCKRCKRTSRIDGNITR